MKGQRMDAGWKKILFGLLPMYSIVSYRTHLTKKKPNLHTVCLFCFVSVEIERLMFSAKNQFFF